METLTRVRPIPLNFACPSCDTRLLIVAPPLNAFSQLHAIMEMHTHPQGEKD